MDLPMLSLLFAVVSLAAPAADEPAVAGSVWAGPDSNGRAYVFRFLEGGGLSYTSPEGTFTNGTWKQDGKTVTWELNNRFVVYTATLDGDKLAGEAVSKNGTKKTFSFKRQAEGGKPRPTRPAAPSVLGSGWTGTTKDDLPIVLRFQKDGKLEYVLEGKTFREGTWKQDGDLITFAVNGGFAEYEGTLKGDGLSGRAKNQRGDEWEWQAKKGEAPPKPPSETKPAETKPAETRPMPSAPMASAPSVPAPTQAMATKPAETKPMVPIEPKPLPPAMRPTQPLTLPGETKPGETKPGEPARPLALPSAPQPAQPTMPKPFETKPAVPKPFETKPAVPKPEETKPARPAFTFPKLVETKPAETKPAEPPAAAGEKLFIDSQWVGKDADGDTFFIRFARGGVGESQRGGVPTRELAWRLSGDRLEFELNRGFSKYAGTVLSRNRVEGTATNKKGQTWSWSLTRLTTETDLAGTTWSGEDSDREKFSFRFLEDGQLEFIRETGVMRKANWRVVGDKVLIDVNGKFSVYEGTLKGDVLEGKASNIKGKKWTWKVTRQKGQ